LTLTPQLQQSIRLLQLSTLDLEMEISQALADNPLLERADGSEDGGHDGGESLAGDASVDAQRDEPAAEHESERQDAETLGEGMTLSDLTASGSGASGYDDDDVGRPESAGAATLREHLLSQLGVTRASERDKMIAALLIDELDQNGYLASPLEDIITWFHPAEGDPDLSPDPDGGSGALAPDMDELRAALALVQSFDPAGIGAANLSECLILQLRHPPQAVAAKVVALARDICRHHLPLLATGNATRLRDALQCDEATLKAAHTLILKLDPRPGRALTVPAADFAVPDVVVRRLRQGWRVSLNHAAVPRLQVNSLYAQMLGNQRASQHAGLQAQLQQAKWMIRNVEQRFDTIMRVSQAIVDRQAAFFSEGPQAMRPLILKDIAMELGMHESTISRATTQKYMLTPFGTLELKFFFGSGVATESGDSASATAVQAFIRKLVEAENRAKPLSDNQITKKLAESGIVIARRTVAKYRESLRIAPAALRRAHAAAR